MLLDLQATLGEVTKNVAWISLQPGGGISVGLRDRVFVSPHFRARSFLWNVYNRVTTEYLVRHTPEALKAVRNPHLTFHPPIYFHLRENDQEELFAGIADVAIMLEMDGIVPWIRFISKPYSAIPDLGYGRGSIERQEAKVSLPSEQESVAVSIDFVRCGTPLKEEHGLSLVYKHFGRCLHIYANPCEGQIATLAWYHQS